MSLSTVPVIVHETGNGEKRAMRRRVKSAKCAKGTRDAKRRVAGFEFKVSSSKWFKVVQHWFKIVDEGEKRGEEVADGKKAGGRTTRKAASNWERSLPPSLFCALCSVLFRVLLWQPVNDLTPACASATLGGVMTDVEIARQHMQHDALAFEIVKRGRVLRTGTREGIGELLEAVEALGEEVMGASLADKIVGKAVAMVTRAVGIQAVHATLASQAALDALAQDGVPLTYERLVPLILNKRNDGPCPMERLTLPLADPKEAVAALRDFVRARRAAP